MVDVFRESVVVKFPKNAPVWRAFDATSAHMLKALSGLPGKMNVDKIRVRSTTGTEVERTTAREGHQFLKEHDQEVRELVQFMTSEPKGVKHVTWDEVDARVQISNEFWNPGTIHVSVSATNKITCDGLAAAAKSFAKRVADDPRGVLTSLPSENVTSSPRSAPIESIGVAGVATGAGARTSPPVAPAVAPEATPKESWLKQTWRDHTVTFVITVVGTVLGAALITWLNIS